MGSQGGHRKRISALGPPAIFGSTEEDWGSEGGAGLVADNQGSNPGFGQPQAEFLIS